VPDILGRVNALRFVEAIQLLYVVVEAAQWIVPLTALRISPATWWLGTTALAPPRSIGHARACFHNLERAVIVQPLGKGCHKGRRHG